MALLIQSPSFSMKSLSLLSDNLDTQTKSCQFLKTVLPWAISSILYRRCNFDEKYLKHRQMHNVPYVGFKTEIPKEHCAYKLFKASRVFQTLILEKHLKEVIIVIEDKGDEKKLEEFVFAFKYLSRDDDADDVTSSGNRNSPMSKQLAKFHMQINSIPDEIKYSEANIRIQFSCRLYEGVPRSIIARDLKTMKKNRLANAMSMVARLKTDFHMLQLFIWEQPAATPMMQKIATTQASNNSTNLPDYSNAMSPDSLEGHQFHSAPSECGQKVTSEEFVQYSEQLDNNLILKPIRFHTPKPKTEIIKNLKKKCKLATGFELVKPLGRKQSSSSTFCSDISSV